MSRLIKSTLPFIAALALMPLAATALAQPVAHAARTCGVGSGVNKWGYAYIFPFSVTRTTCGVGAAVIRKHGHLRGWHCSTKRLQSSSIQYTDQETCKSGSRKVLWKYTQNT